MKASKPLRDGIKSLADQFHHLSPKAKQGWLSTLVGAAAFGPTLIGLGQVALGLSRILTLYQGLKALPPFQFTGMGARGALGAAEGATAIGGAVASTAPITLPITALALAAKRVAEQDTERSQDISHELAAPRDKRIRDLKARRNALKQSIAERTGDAAQETDENSIPIGSRLRMGARGNTVGATAEQSARLADYNREIQVLEHQRNQERGREEAKRANAHALRSVGTSSREP